MTTITVTRSVPVPGGKEGETMIIHEQVEVLDSRHTGVLPEKDAFPIGLAVQAGIVESAT